MSPTLRKRTFWHPRRLIRGFVVRMIKTLHPWLSKRHAVKVQISLREYSHRLIWIFTGFAQADLNLRWSHMSEGTFSYVTYQMVQNLRNWDKDLHFRPSLTPAKNSSLVQRCRSFSYLETVSNLKHSVTILRDIKRFWAKRIKYELY